MTNEQVQAPSHDFIILTKIIWIFLAGLFIGVPLLEYLITGTLHPRGIGVIMLMTVACSVALGAFFTLAFFGAQRYEWIGTYGAIFSFVTLISALPAMKYLNPEPKSAPLMTLVYAALVGAFVSILVAAVLIFFRRLRPARTD